MGRFLKAQRLYVDGDFLDMVDATLPDIEFLSVAEEGAGVLGNVEIPLDGITENMTTSMTLHNITKYEVGLMAGVKNFELRGSEQLYNPVTGELEESAVRHVMRTAPKKITGGSSKKGESNGSSFEGNVLYYKKEVDGEAICEVDKYAMKCVINGVDLLAKTRANVGM